MVVAVVSVVYLEYQIHPFLSRIMRSKYKICGKYNEINDEKQISIVLSSL